MTTWQLIRSMIQRGYEFTAGPHTPGLLGYWAQFLSTEFIADCPECENCGARVTVNSWTNTGHAMTLHRAVVMAAKIALGREVTVPPLEHFKP